jgi:hypothetical protein
MPRHARRRLEETTMTDETPKPSTKLQFRADVIFDEPGGAIAIVGAKPTKLEFPPNARIHRGAGALAIIGGIPRQPAEPPPDAPPAAPPAAPEPRR